MTRLRWTPGFFHWNLVESIGHVCHVWSLRGKAADNLTCCGPKKTQFAKPQLPELLTGSFWSHDCIILPIPGSAYEHVLHRYIEIKVRF